MELFIEKLDQELFTAYNVDNNMEKVNVLWKKVAQYPIIINDACKLLSVEKVFRAPMMVYLALKYPGTVSPEIFESIKNIILSDEIIANTSLVTEGIVCDSYLCLLLQDKNIIFTMEEKAFIKSALLKQSSFNTPEFKKVEYVLFDQQDIVEEQDVRLSINDLYIQMSKKELAFMLEGNKKIVSDNKRETYDARYWVFGNPNFTAEEKKAFGHYLYSNPYEFEHVVTTILYDITKKYNLEISPFRLLMLRDEELRKLGVYSDVSYVKSIIDTREHEKEKFYVNSDVVLKRARA